MNDHRSNDGCDERGDDGLLVVDNPPAQDAIRYRIGAHARFKRLLLAGLSDGARLGLRGLTTRDDGDFSIALLDAWAVAADVVTFYQERIAAESYLRTATERRSLVEMARLLGYRPQPGIAAETLLAVIAEGDDPQRPLRLAPGLQVQSVPAPGETSQVFETVEPLELRPAWNALRPAAAGPQTFTNALRLRGAALGLQPGAVLILHDTGDPAAAQAVVLDAVAVVGGDTEVRWSGFGWLAPPRARLQVFAPRRSAAVLAVLPNLVQLAGPSPTAHADTDRIVVLEGARALATRADPIAAQQPPDHVDGFEIGGPADGLSAPPGAFTAAARVHYDADPLELAADPVADDRLFLRGTQTGVRPGDTLYLVRAGDPTRWRLVTVGAATPDPARGLTTVRLAASAPALQLPIAGPLQAFTLRAQAALFGHNAPSRRQVVLGADSDDWSNFTPPDGALDLDAIQPRILPGDPIFALDPAGVTRLDVRAARTVARADFGLVATVTRLELEPGARPTADLPLRTTRVLAQPEPLALAGAPLDEPVSGDSIVLAGAHPELAPGRVLLVVGPEHGGRGEPRSEAVTVRGALVDGDITRVTVAPPLRSAYRRDAALIHGNVARATHGESFDEVLGSGDAGRTFQRFALPQAPLTYLRAGNAAGRTAALHVFVDGLRWREVDDLAVAGPDDRVYALREDEDGTTLVQFGDGRHGARLPTGRGNVRAVFRRGSGRAGELRPGQLSLLLTRPLGVKSVTSPLPAVGADDPEPLADARRNLPRTVLTLDRVVSLQDYEDYARSYPGVAKARATALWDGRRAGELLTLAGPGGARVDPEGPVRRDLAAALRAAGDPHVPISVHAYRPVAFHLSARLVRAPDVLPADVAAAARLALAHRFGFPARDFGQPVHLSEVISVLQSVPGALAVAVDRLARDPATTDPPPTRLSAAPPARALDQDPAELLTLDLATLVLEVTA